MSDKMQVAFAAHREAAVAHAHASIYDHHHPLRCKLAVDAVNTVPGLTMADKLALAAVVVGNCLSVASPAERINLKAGVDSIIASFVEEADRLAQEAMVAALAAAPIAGRA